MCKTDYGFDLGGFRPDPDLIVEGSSISDSCICEKSHVQRGSDAGQAAAVMAGSASESGIHQSLRADRNHLQLYIFSNREGL